jgi:hypothetical protein
LQKIRSALVADPQILDYETINGTTTSQPWWLVRMRVVSFGTFLGSTSYAQRAGIQWLLMINETKEEYIRRIASKGGKALVGTPAAKAKASKAAKARWAKAKRKKDKK